MTPQEPAGEQLELDVGEGDGLGWDEWFRALPASAERRAGELLRDDPGDRIRQRQR